MSIYFYKLLSQPYRWTCEYNSCHIILPTPTTKLLLSLVSADLYVQPCVDSESLHRSGLLESCEMAFV